MRRVLRRGATARRASEHLQHAIVERLRAARIGEQERAVRHEDDASIVAADLPRLREERASPVQ